MKVALLEFIDEFEAFQAFLLKENLKIEDFIIIALEPQLQAYLKRQGIDYENTLQYFSNESHGKIIIETEKVMHHIAKHFQFVDSNEMKSCYKTEFAHYVRFYLNHMFKMLEILENVFRKNSGIALYAYVENRLTSSLLINDMERYAGVLSESFATSRNIKFINFNQSAPNLIHEEERNSLSVMERAIAKSMRALLSKRSVVLIPRASIAFRGLINKIRRKDKNIVFLAIDCNDGVIKMLIFNFFSFFKSFLRIKGGDSYYRINLNFLHRTVSEEEQKKLLKYIDAIMDSQYGFLYEYNGISYCALLKTKIDLSLRNYMADMLFKSHAMEYLFNGLQNKIIISDVAMGAMGIAGELSRKKGVKSLFISHGAHPEPVDSYHEIELLNLCKGFMFGSYTHVALSTPVQEGHLHYFKQKYQWIRNHEMKTGPLIFADLTGSDKSLQKAKLGFSTHDTVLTYATTTKYRSAERFYFIETLDEFISSLSDIVATVNMSKNMRLIIRIHPGFHLTDDEIKTLLPGSDRIAFHRHGTFSEALAATDILISYSSTAIDEALINRVPVVLYDKWKRYNHFRTGVFNSPESADIFPVCYLNDASKLSDAILYMKDKVENTKKEDMDVSRYSYNENFSGNFFSFVRDCLKK